MSVRVQTYVWQLSLKQGQKLVALAMADHCHDDGSEARPSRALVAKKCGMSERQVTRVLAELVELGVLELERAASHHRCNVYRFPLPEDFAVLRSGQPVDKTVGGEKSGVTNGTSGVTNATVGVTNDAFRGDAHVTLTIREPSLEPSREPKMIISHKSAISENAEILPITALDAQFDQVWALYPRKIGKAAAQKAFRARLREGVALGDLITATEAYAANQRGLDATYTMHGSTFFGPNERWKDYLPGGAAHTEQLVKSVPQSYSAISSWLSKVEG